MKKLELIQALRDPSRISKTEAESVVNIFFNTMSDRLADGRLSDKKVNSQFWEVDYV